MWRKLLSSFFGRQLLSHASNPTQTCHSGQMTGTGNPRGLIPLRRGSRHLTRNPFSIPVVSRKTWNVRQSVVSPRLNRRSGGSRGFHRLPSFLAGVGFIIFLGLCGFAAQKVVDIRHPSWYRHPRWQGRAAFFQSATSCRWEYPPSGGEGSPLGTARMAYEKGPQIPSSQN